MGIIDRLTLKNLFKTARTPSQNDYWNWFDSYVHKNDKISTYQVSGLSDALAGKLDTEASDNILKAVQDNSLTMQALKDQTADVYNDGANSVAADVVKKIDSGTRALITYKKMAAAPTISADIYKNFGGAYYVDSVALDNDGISVRRFGCRCDGVTDDTAAFQKALNFAKAVPDTVLIIPNGTCMISALIIDQTAGLTIKGKGTIKKFGAGKENIFYVANSSRVTFKDFNIDGAGWSISMDNGYQGCGILTSKCYTLDFQNLTVNNMPGGGVITTDSQDVAISECKFYGNKTLADIAFGYATPVAPLTGFRCTDNVCMSPNYFGILVQGYGSDVYISGNTVKNKTIYGINVYRRDMDQTQIWSKVIIDGNIVENISDTSDQRNPGTQTYYGMGIFLQTVHQVTVSNNIVRNVLLARSEVPVSRTLTPGAIAVGDCTCYKVVNNIIENSAVDGISISASVYFDTESSLVMGNTVKDCGYYGIFNINSPNVAIQNNSILAAKSSPVRVYKSTAGDLSAVSVMGNRIYCTPETSNNALDFSGGSDSNFKNCDIVDNKIYNAALYAISVLWAKDSTVRGNQIINEDVAPGSAYHAVAVQKCDTVDVKGNNISGSKKYGKSIYLNQVNRGFIRENYVPVAPEVESNCQNLQISDNIV